MKGLQKWAEVLFCLRLTPHQLEVLTPHVKGKAFHDLGACSLEQATALVWLGAKKVVAVEGKWDKIPKPRSKKIECVRSYFQDYQGTPENVFLSWPTNTGGTGLDRLAEMAQTVVYIGKNTDGTVCGTPALWRHLVTREVLAYSPESRNTLIVYGPARVSRKRQGEELGALSREILSYKVVEK